MESVFSVVTGKLNNENSEEFGFEDILDREVLDGEDIVVSNALNNVNF